MATAGVIRCQYCGWVVIDDNMAKNRFSYVCPKCREYIHNLTCIRCGYEWAPNNFNKLPRCCPSCKSPYWNRPRVRNARTRVAVGTDFDERGADE